jgi:hypothetical protein
MSVAFKLVAIFCGLVGLASNALGQETPVWSDIDCAESKIEGPAGLRCRVTQEYAGGSAREGKIALKGNGAGGTSRHWAKSGTVNGTRYSYFLKEATSVGTNVAPISLEATVKQFGVQGQRSSDFSKPTPIAGGDFLTYTDRNGENCIAVRKLGASTKYGNTWYLMATQCGPKGKKLSEADGVSLLASANAPRAGY